MTKLFYAFSPIVLVFIILSFTGCESTGVSTGEAVIKGRVTDSKTFVQIIGAEITTTPATTTVMSDSLGNFIIPGIAAGSYTVTAKKYGYGTKSSTVEVTGSDTSTVAIKMDWLNIYTFNNIVVDEYWQDSSHSAVNIYLGYITTELDNANKDIQSPRVKQESYDSTKNRANFFILKQRNTGINSDDSSRKVDEKVYPLRVTVNDFFIKDKKIPRKIWQFLFDNRKWKYIIPDDYFNFNTYEESN